MSSQAYDKLGAASSMLPITFMIATGGITSATRWGPAPAAGV